MYEILILFLLFPRYELNTSTYGYIIPEISCHSLVGCGVKATLRKQETGAMWTRFIHSPLNQPWLTRDFSYWLDNNVSDDEEKLEPVVDPIRIKFIIRRGSLLSKTYNFLFQNTHSTKTNLNHHQAIQMKSVMMKSGWVKMIEKDCLEQSDHTTI